MKRLPALGNFILFIALCASVAYWLMQFFQPQPRVMVAPPSAAPAPPEISAAAGLFGGRVQATAASNFQLTGIILADQPGESIAIIAASGKPARPFRVHAQIQPGISVQEVQRNYVLLSDHGTGKRLDLPVNAKTPPGTNLLPPTPVVNAAPQPTPVAPLPPAPLPNNPPPPATLPNALLNQANRHTGSFLPR